MVKAIFLIMLLGSSPLLAKKKPKHAKNVIVFLADAAGIPTLNAASIMAHEAPLKLYVQSWPNMGLSNTSTASQWVTDSAAGMTAIVTGEKTHNGVISQAADSKRGQKDGRDLKTILEYAEEKGLTTGVLSNVAIADATPAACYSHVNDRGNFGDIFLQIFEPRFGDGIDIVFGPGRKYIFSAVKEKGKDLDQVAAQHNRKIYSSMDQVPPDAKRAIAVLDQEIDLPDATRRAISIASKNRKGYFLMVEWDSHTDNPEKGLSNLVKFDSLIKEVASSVNLDDTLLLFTADHSFDFRVRGGGPGKPLLTGFDEWRKTEHEKKATIKLPYVRVDDSHTGEEVLVTAEGPGADMVHGFMPNTNLFHIMMSAYGWKADKSAD